MQQYLLYQAYGNKSIMLECWYSLIKLIELEQENSFCIVVYTDDPVFFSEVLEPFPQHEIIPIDTGKIQQWKGPYDFVHRVKIEIMLDFLSTHKGKVLYMDTDTYCLSSLFPLFTSTATGNFIMHECEGKIGSRKNVIFKKWMNFLKRFEYNGQLINRPENIAMWNAGVIGMTASNIDLLKDVLALTDRIYKEFSSHTAEQFAFSYVLQHSGTLKAADTIIYHYWDLKEFRELLPQLYDKYYALPPQQRSALIKKLLPENIFAEKQQHKKKPFYIKWFVQKWGISKYVSLLNEY